MEYQGQLNSNELRELFREQAERFVRPVLPLYGLDGSWTGTRELGGWEPVTGTDMQTGDVSSDVEYGLAHGGPRGSTAAYVRVVSTTDRRHKTLPWRLVCVMEPTPFEGRICAVSDPDHVPPGARRIQIQIPLDERPASFDLLVRGEYFVAAAERTDHLLVVEGRGVDPEALRLVTVRDVGPYLAGTEARRRK